MTTIGNWTFGHNQLSSVTIPDSVTSIGVRAFASNQLTTVIIGNNVTIDSDAFASNLLISVTIGSVVNINSDPNTMGTNTGFKTVYDGEGAGIYNYTGGIWVKE